MCGEENNYTEKMWHTAAHVFANALIELYPKAKIAIGPPIEQGFHYDFELAESIDSKALEKIEARMKEILQRKEKMIKGKMGVEEALKFFENNPYKVEMINDLANNGKEKISTYTNGDFVDMCKGPHLESISEIGAVKLLKTSSAYWKGNEKNAVLQRVYGIGFKTQKELDEWAEARKKAEENSHVKLGKELDLFITSEVIGKGLPLFTPRGAMMMQVLQRFIEDEETKRGYLRTRTPVMTKSDLYKISGHYTHYKESMFQLEIEGSEYFLRPMTCPHQYMIYKSKQYSYRDMPIRLGEVAQLFRKEQSGELHGIVRVWQFTLNDAHLIVRPDQLEEEINSTLELIQYCMKKLGIKDYWYRFSKWDPNNKEKYIDNPEMWEKAQAVLKSVLDKSKMNYEEAENEAAFYGPKIDIQARNVYGKEDSLFTVQVDFAAAEKFDMNYIEKDGTKQRPVVVHRAAVGCLERTIAFMLEQTGGNLPFWLSPEQIRIIPVSEKFIENANELKKKLMDEGYRIEVDIKDQTLGNKIRNAQLLKIPLMLVFGEKEKTSGEYQVRERNGTQYKLGYAELIEKLKKLQEE
ncbi:MAG: threonine--tRNA ligase [Candidatus Diapherotrites archaeon]|nr:threonine--tRNA ligase [Candidatus Diapherotrites archaeon]